MKENQQKYRQWHFTTETVSAAHAASSAVLILVSLCFRSAFIA